MTGPMPVRPLPILALALALLTAAPASPAGTTQHVLVKGIDYQPRQITVHVGDTVAWANQDIVAHTATAKDRSWDVTVLPGKEGHLVMKVPGTFDYICRYHPNMTGQIVVEP
jgi:plastocyanin